MDIISIEDTSRINKMNDEDTSVTLDTRIKVQLRSFIISRESKMLCKF